MSDPAPGALPPSSGRGDRRAPHVAVDVAVLLSAKLAAGAWLLHHGFSHVSDDDYARTVIAEQFAHAPRLDPSGTSWLPLPFWLVGAAMAAAGRSLDTARGVALTLGAVAVLAPYGAMRAARVPRAAALAATAVAMVLPWNAWLGAAPVPEGWAGALAAAGAIALGSRGARPWAAAALVAASLARYEAWPVCAVACAAWTWEGCRGRADRAALAWAAVAAAGPLLWMAWNAHAHGSALHFFARVSRFRQATGAAGISFGDRLLGYPRALLLETPEAVLLGLVGAAGVARDPALRTRWRWGLTAAAAVLAFLVVGDLGDGAPTHHPARALAPAWWILVGVGVDATGAGLAALARGGARSMATAGVAAASLAWCSTLPSRWVAAPGETDAERRDAQIARGLDMRARHVASAEVTPCAFEHFAMLAAWGEPEAARVARASGGAPGAECPRVVEGAGER